MKHFKLIIRIKQTVETTDTVQFFQLLINKLQKSSRINYDIFLRKIICILLFLAKLLKQHNLV